MALLLALSVSNCAYTPITVPEFKPIIQKPADCTVTKPTVCPEIGVPLPIPDDVELVIKGGKVKKINDGGVLLVRQYAAVIKALENSK